MIPQTPQQIRAWVERLKISEALAAEALGLGNPGKVMREYCSPTHPREPARTTRMHMDLMETLVEVHRALGARDVGRACALVEHALITRDLIEATTNQGENACLTK